MDIHDALHLTVHSAPGGAEALAARLGMSAQILRNKVNPITATNHATWRDVDLILGLTGDYRALHALARNHGHVCIRVDESVPVGDMAIVEALAQVLSASGEVGAEVHATLADGIVEQWEIERVRAAVYKVNQTLNQMVARLERMAEK
jgi:hypothetical protein